MYLFFNKDMAFKYKVFNIIPAAIAPTIQYSLKDFRTESFFTLTS